MRTTTAIAIGFLLFSAAAHAQVTGVVTSSTATIQFRPNVNGVPITVTQSGSHINQSSGDANFGSGGTFASTADVVPGLIAFQNGNAASGAYTYSTSTTNIDITFKNDGLTSVVPQLNSEIAAAGLGLYVSNCSLTDIKICGQYTGGHTFQSFSPNNTTGLGVSNDIAGALVDFKILGNGATLYDLTASVTLAVDPITGKNVITSNVLAAAATLNGFTQTSAPGSQTAFGYAWDTTNLTIDYPPGTLLAPGDSATLTYQTTVQSFSRATCYTLLTGACVAGYSSFGDPIGRGGGIKPTVAGLDFAASGAPGGDAVNGLTFGTFGFSLPTFEDGKLSLDGLHPIPSIVPEPGAWLLMTGGFGLVGAAKRRRSRRTMEKARTALA